MGRKASIERAGKIWTAVVAILTLGVLTMYIAYVITEVVIAGTK